MRTQTLVWGHKPLKVCPFCTVSMSVLYDCVRVTQTRTGCDWYILYIAAARLGVPLASCQHGWISFSLLATLISISNTFLRTQTRKNRCWISTGQSYNHAIWESNFLRPKDVFQCFSAIPGQLKLFWKIFGTAWGLSSDLFASEAAMPVEPAEHSRSRHTELPDRRWSQLLELKPQVLIASWLAEKLLMVL